MARYLSPPWFEQVRAAREPLGDDPDVRPDLVLRQVVTGGPDGEVRYQVEVRGDRARLVEGVTGDADMTFTSDYPTAVAIARGELSTQAGLLQGRIRVSGSPVELTEHHRALDAVPGMGHLDPVPPRVRAETTFP
jgi:hypothetical protein